MARERVLLLEDDPQLQAVLRELFDEEDVDVTVCTSIDDIHTAVQRFPRAVVVSDSWSTTDQQTLSPQQRAEIISLGQTAGVILITGRAWARDRDVGDIGTAVILQKPFDLQQLLERVRTALGASQRISSEA